MNKYIAIAALPVSLAVAQASGSNDRGQEDKSADAQEELTYEEAYKWLDSKEVGIAIETGTDTVFYHARFLPTAELTKARIAGLNKGVIDKLIYFEPGEVIGTVPIEVINYPVNENRLAECSALIQIAKTTRGNGLPDEVEKQLTHARNYVPDHPLDANCEYLDPWQGYEAFDHTGVISIDGTLAIYEFGNLTTIDENLGCDDFSPSRDGVFDITPETKAIIRSSTNYVPDRIYRTRMTSRIALDFEEGWKQGLADKNGPQIQSMTNDYLAEQPRVIRVDYAIIDDDEADQFCFVSTVKQGETRWVEIFREPRNGRRSNWTGLGESDPPLWYGPTAARNFGKRVGAEMMGSQTSPRAD